MMAFDVESSWDGAPVFHWTQIVEVYSCMHVRHWSSVETRPTKPRRGWQNEPDRETSATTDSGKRPCARI